jgi:ABC-type transporter Mla MlaB component
MSDAAVALEAIALRADFTVDLTHLDVVDSGGMAAQAVLLDDFSR